MDASDRVIERVDWQSYQKGEQMKGIIHSMRELSQADHQTDNHGLSRVFVM